MDQYQCCTCNYVGSVYEIACGGWQTCRNFAKAKTEGTLPNPFPRIGGGPTSSIFDELTCTYPGCIIVGEHEGEHLFSDNSPITLREEHE